MIATILCPSTGNDLVDAYLIVLILLAPNDLLVAQLTMYVLVYTLRLLMGSKFRMHENVQAVWTRRLVM